MSVEELKVVSDVRVCIGDKEYTKGDIFSTEGVQPGVISGLKRAKHVELIDSAEVKAKAKAEAKAKEKAEVKNKK